VGEEIEVDGGLADAHSLDAYLAGLRAIGQPREMNAAGEAPVLSADVLSVCVP
jgi:hypothetical protein